MRKKKLVYITALVVGTALAAGAAQARDRNDVQWSITIGAPIGLPIHSQPRPVYLQPYPVYPQRYYPAHAYQQPTRWDRDGDGISNRHDPVFNPRWDRDGDGIPNRYDRPRHVRGDRDGDGIPNWQDRNYRPRGR